MEKRNQARDRPSRVKLAALTEILEKYSDEEHPITTQQIQHFLSEEYGIEVHRSTVAKDIEALRESGLDIISERTSRNRYYLRDRQFQIPEIKLIVDAIASSKFITEKKSEELIEKMGSFVSVWQLEKIKHNIHTESRIKPGNERSFYTVDRINDAINSSKKVSFTYFEYNAEKEKVLKNDGEPYVFSPYALVWNGDYYYTVGYSDKHGKIISFRVDRIDSIPEILEEDAVPEPESFNVLDYTTTVFQMYDESRALVTLLCKNEMMKVIIDRFGEDVLTRIYDAEHFTARVEVALSPLFFGWIFGFGGDITILRPREARRKYFDMVKKALSEEGEEK